MLRFKEKMSNLILKCKYHKLHLRLKGNIRFFFGSPEPKAQVIFSDQNLSVARRRRHRRRCNVFIFSSFSTEPLGQFQPNVAQIILG